MLKIDKLAVVMGVAALPLTSCTSEVAKPKIDGKPNVIFILADDLGIGDLGCYGQKQIKTPAIDDLAAKGLKFTNHYSGSTVSAPSRCVTMTGKHTGHSVIRGNKGLTGPDGRHYDLDMDGSEITVAELFKTADYKTACCGKWGLGSPEKEGLPNRQGFDYFFGYLGQANAHSYYPDQLFENENPVMLGKKVYTHDMIMEKALAFVDENADEPFFLYLTPTIPHADLDVPNDEFSVYDNMFFETPYAPVKGGYKHQPNPRATFAKMVSRLDRDVERLVQLLEKKGILENTIIIFTSDNGTHKEGGHDPEYFDSNGPFRGSKRDLYEGGIRTPFIVRWDKQVAANTISYHVSTFWDFLPTVCDITGAVAPADIDGISYLPTLLNEGVQKKHDYLYFEFHEEGGKQCVIKDGWKLLRLNVNKPEKESYELYNLAYDPSEIANSAAQYPEKVAELQKLMSSSRTTNQNWLFNFEK